MAFGNNLVMEENLDNALKSILGEQVIASPEKQAVSPLVTQSGSSANLGKLALEHYRRAKESIRTGNWSEYGKELENLEKILEKMAGEPEE